MIRVNVRFQRFADVFRKRQHPRVFARAVVVQDAGLPVFGAELFCGRFIERHVRPAFQRRFVDCNLI
jgi:hypothetical protein